MINPLRYALQHTLANWLLPNTNKIIKAQQDAETTVLYRLKVLASECKTSPYSGQSGCAVNKALCRLLDPKYKVLLGSKTMTIYHEAKVVFETKIPAHYDQYHHAIRTGEDFYLPIELPRRILNLQDGHLPDPRSIVAISKQMT